MKYLIIFVCFLLSACTDDCKEGYVLKQTGMYFLPMNIGGITQLIPQYTYECVKND